MTISLGELLIERGKLDRSKLGRALRLQEEAGERLGTLLVQLGFVAERDVAEMLAVQLDQPFARPEDYPDAPVLNDRISHDFLRQASMAPLSDAGGSITVAMADPLDHYARDALGFALGLPVSTCVGTPSDIESALQRQYPDEVEGIGEIVETDSQYASDAESDDVEQLRDLASEAPIIRMVNLIVSRALKVGASDIHIEPFEDTLKVRYRVDGVLRDAEAPSSQYGAAVVSRIKVMASLDIAERRLPQDGRIRLRMEGREIDMRISTVPTMHGESVVMRILDKGSLPLDFRALGFTPKVLSRFEEMLARPQGIILVTGPTGSGKTTTLYAALHALNTPERKILTVEDPVEYQLQGVNQIPVKPRIGLDFAQALRSFLRQDPDVMMVGEMRDTETARIAVQAALTGHKVFSTLHTNDAASSVTRLLDMGIEDFLVTATVSGVVAQRLVRTLCPDCREPERISPELIERLRVDRVAAGTDVTLYRPVGCARCDGTGFRGRTCVLELLVMSEPVREAVLGSRGASDIGRVAREQGMTTMYEDGLDKALAGVTTVEEVVRAVQEA